MGTQGEGGDTGNRLAQLLGHEVGEAGGVEHPGLADHPLVGKAGGELGQRGHLVKRVGHHDDHGLRGMLGHVFGDPAHNAGVDLNEVHPAHTGFTRQSSRNHHDV